MGRFKKGGKTLCPSVRRKKIRGANFSKKKQNSEEFYRQGEMGSYCIPQHPEEIYQMSNSEQPGPSDAKSFRAYHFPLRPILPDLVVLIVREVLATVLSRMPNSRHQIHSGPSSSSDGL